MTTTRWMLFGSVLLLGNISEAQFSPTPAPIPTASPTNSLFPPPTPTPPSTFFQSPTPTPIPYQTPPPEMQGSGYPLPPNPWVVQPGQQPQPQPLPPGAATPSTNPQDFGYPLPPNPWEVQPGDILPEPDFPGGSGQSEDLFNDDDFLPPTEPSTPVYPDDMQSPFSSPFENQTFPPLPQDQRQQQTPQSPPPAGSMRNGNGVNAARQPQSTAGNPTPTATPIKLRVLPPEPASKANARVKKPTSAQREAKPVDKKKAVVTASTKTSSNSASPAKNRAPASIKEEPWTDRREFHVTLDEPVPSLIREAGVLLQSADARMDAMEEEAESTSMGDRALLYQAAGFISAHRQRLTVSLAALKSDRDSTNKKGILVEAMNETRGALRRFDDGVTRKDFR